MSTPRTKEGSERRMNFLKRTAKEIKNYRVRKVIFSKFQSFLRIIGNGRKADIVT